MTARQPPAGQPLPGTGLIPERPPTAATAATAATAVDVPPGRVRRRPGRWLHATAQHRAARHLTILLGYLLAGILLTWPRASYLTGRLPANTDQAQYVWSLWWVAHQVVHLGNPWFTHLQAAPGGTSLAYDTFMPLVGVLMTPVTLIFGPSASFNLLAIVVPGLACYLMFRLASLWLPTVIGGVQRGRPRSAAQGMASQRGFPPGAALTGAIAAGALFGLSTAFVFQDWWHLNIAIGALFLPLTLEVAIRLRRRPTVGGGVLLGLVLGACPLVDQESAVICLILTCLVLAPWLVRGFSWLRLKIVAAAAASTAVIASPQLIAMVTAAASREVSFPSGTLKHGYVRYGASLAGLFAPSPRVGNYGLGAVARLYQYRVPHEAVATFGVALSLLALTGLVACWRRRGTKLAGLLWLGGAVLALGPTLAIGLHSYAPVAVSWRGLRVSALLPYTWLVHVPGMTIFRESDRFILPGLVGAALLAGAGVQWLLRRAWPVLVVLTALALLEAGMGGTQPTMPTALPRLSGPIAADKSGSIVVDVPFGLQGGFNQFGDIIAPGALLLATADGHPRAISFTSWVGAREIENATAQPFYVALLGAQDGLIQAGPQLAAARRDSRSLHVGWVLVWRTRMPPSLYSFLAGTGFRFDYRADGVSVYRSVSARS